MGLTDEQLNEDLRLEVKRGQISNESKGQTDKAVKTWGLGKSLGSNTNNANVETLADLGFTRIEVCLGRHKPYQDMLERAFSDLDTAKTLGMNYTIHFPLYLFDWFPFDYLDGLYLDPDPVKRDLAFRFLEENLRHLAPRYAPDYFILHFPGIYRNAYKGLNFKSILHHSLARLQDLAERYRTVFALEYFGSNRDFSDASQWIEALDGYSRLAPLLDTGHLYFSCLMNGYEFDEVFERLAPHCIGFHVWTVRGTEFYGNSPFYRQYHHVVPHPEQLKSDGWAFDPGVIYHRLGTYNAPVVLEASGIYGGRGYYLEGLNYAAACFLRGECK